MNHIAVNLSLANKRNLLKLARHLEGKKPRGMVFDMTGYFQSADGYGVDASTAAKMKSMCGTTACALGECAFLFKAAAKKTKNWDSLCEDLFGFRFRCNADIPFEEEMRLSPAWGWVFASIWAESDNTRRGVAARIRYMLKYGIPENWRQQSLGTAKLCYKVK